jgi:ABC-type multidrug transport system permease subunit
MEKEQPKKNFVIIKVLESNYCKLVFLLSLVLSYFLVPKHLVGFWWNLIIIIFMLVFSLNMTCIVRNIKERIKTAKTTTNSVINLIASGLGIMALQVCGTSGYFCSASILMGLFSSVLPHFLLDFLKEYSLYIILATILFQIISLRNMKCFKKIASF